jgi:hypothetical protein
MTRYLSHVTQLPYVIVYDAAGARVGDLDGFEPADIDALIDRARGE